MEKCFAGSPNFITDAIGSESVFIKAQSEPGAEIQHRRAGLLHWQAYEYPGAGRLPVFG